MLTARAVLSLYEASPPIEVWRDQFGVWENPSRDDLLEAANQGAPRGEPPGVRFIADSATTNLWVTSCFGMLHDTLVRILRSHHVVDDVRTLVSGIAYYRGGGWDLPEIACYVSVSKDDIARLVFGRSWEWVANYFPGTRAQIQEWEARWKAWLK